MPLILISALMFPILLAAAHKLNKKLIQAMPFCLLGIAAFQYLLGLFGLLSFGVWALRGAWLFSCGYLVIALIKKQLKLTWLLTECAFPLIFTAFAWWLCRGRSFSNWDEFSHWGIALKGLFYENVLPSVTTFDDGFKNYPPIISVLQYTLAKAAGYGFREDIVLFVQALFSASILAYPLKAVKSALGKGIMLAALLILPLTIYPFFYTTTVMDGVLGVLFGFIVIVYVLEKNSAFKYAFLALAGFTLCLTKTTGILFFAFAAVIMLIDILIKRQFNIKAFLPFAFAAAGAAAGQISWQIHTSLNNVAQRWSVSSFSFSALADLLFKGKPQYRADTVNNFFKNVVGDFNYGSVLHFPYVAWFALFALCVFLIARFAKSSINKFAVKICCFLIGGGILYMFLTLGSYLFAFSEYEAVNVASLSRYLNTFLIAILFFMLALLAPLLNEFNIKQKGIFAVSYLIIWFLLVSPSPKNVLANIINAPKSSAISSNEASVYISAAKLMLSATNNNPEKVRVICQYDYGFTPIRLAYELLPVSYKADFSSIRTEETATEDFWSEYHTADTLEKQLYDNYDYVYVVFSNQLFTDNFNSLFENPAQISNHTMYKINKDNGKVTLTHFANGIK